MNGLTFFLHSFSSSASNKEFRKSGAFTLVELMVIVAIIGTLSAVGLAIGTQELRRASMNSVQLSMAGWLQAVQRNALLRKSESGCLVSFNAITNQGQGAELATVSPPNCSLEPTLRLNLSTSSNATFSTSSTQSQIRFTPRGTTIYPGLTDQDPIFQYRIVRDNSQPIACIQVSGLAGVVAIGSNLTSSSLSDSCSNFNVF